MMKSHRPFRGGCRGSLWERSKRQDHSKYWALRELSQSSIGCCTAQAACASASPVIMLGPPPWKFLRFWCLASPFVGAFCTSTLSSTLTRCWRLSLSLTRGFGSCAWAWCCWRCWQCVPSLTILVFAITFPLVFTVLSPSALHLCDCGHNPTRVTGRDCVVGCCAPGFGLVDGACKALECSCAHGTLLESVCTEFGGEACSECNEGFLLQLALGSTAFLEPFLIFFSCGFASNKNSNFVVFTTRPAVQARRLLQFANLHLSAW